MIYFPTFAYVKPEKKAALRPSWSESRAKKAWSDWWCRWRHHAPNPGGGDRSPRRSSLSKRATIRGPKLSWLATITRTNVSDEASSFSLLTLFFSSPGHDLSVLRDGNSRSTCLRGGDVSLLVSFGPLLSFASFIVQGRINHARRHLPIATDRVLGTVIEFPFLPGTRESVRSSFLLFPPPLPLLLLPRSLPRRSGCPPFSLSCGADALCKIPGNRTLPPRRAIARSYWAFSSLAPSLSLSLFPPFCCGQKNGTS